MVSAALLLCGCGAGGPALEGEEWDLEHISPEDLGYFLQDWPTGRSRYALETEDGQVLTVWRLEGEEEGPSVYVVGGVHGNERAGWYAGTLLSRADIRRGTLYVLAPANPYGAEKDQRETRSGRDLNRSFPGQADGWDAQQLAGEIFDDIQEKRPDLVLDLHEANPGTEGRDALGNSLIVENMDGELGQLVLGLILASEEGALWPQPVTLYGSPPEGSLNRTVSTLLHIPVITVETLRSEPMERRVGNHLEMAEYILEQYGMVGQEAGVERA